MFACEWPKPRKCKLPYAVLRLPQLFTTIHFTNDQDLEIQSSFPLHEESNSSVTGEAMPCASCQTQPKPRGCACSREVFDNSRFALSLLPCAPFLTQLLMKASALRSVGGH